MMASAQLKRWRGDWSRAGLLQTSAWELTPRWMFWLPKWRRAIHGPWHYEDEFWEYADEQKVARSYLEENFGDA